MAVAAGVGAVVGAAGSGSPTLLRLVGCWSGHVIGGIVDCARLAFVRSFDGVTFPGAVDFAAPFPETLRWPANFDCWGPLNPRLDSGWLGGLLRDGDGSDFGCA